MFVRSTHAIMYDQSSMRQPPNEFPVDQILNVSPRGVEIWASLTLAVLDHGMTNYKTATRIPGRDVGRRVPSVR
jgi:hypothetical protein